MPIKLHISSKSVTEISHSFNSKTFDVHCARSKVHQQSCDSIWQGNNNNNKTHGPSTLLRTHENAHDLFALDISQNAVTLMNYALSQYALTCLDKSNSNNPPLKPENGFSSKITNDQTMSNKIFSDGIGVLEKKFLFFDDIDWYRIG